MASDYKATKGEAPPVGGYYGKGGTAKGKGKGKSGKKGKKDESLHRILGRDLINEIDDIKSSLKNQKKLHKK